MTWTAEHIHYIPTDTYVTWAYTSARNTLNGQKKLRLNASRKPDELGPIKICTLSLFNLGDHA